MKRRLRTLVYGVSHEHAYGKFESLKRLADDYEIIALADDRPRGTIHFLDERIDVEKAVRDGFPVVTEDEARGMDGIDVVFIETANADLMEIASCYAERGVAMHCDKPCGEAIEPYRTILGKCEERNIPFQIGYMYRGNPALQWIWREAQAGTFGDIRFVEADMNHNYQSDGYEKYVRSFKGGILYNLGCHLVDMVLPLVGADLASAVPFVDGTDGKSFLRFRSGADVLIRTSAYRPGGILSRRLRIDGTGCTVDLCPIERFDGRPLKVKVTAGKDESIVDFGVQTDRYAAQLADLAAIVRGDKPNDQDYGRDFKVHELTLKACGTRLNNFASLR